MARRETGCFITMCLILVLVGNIYAENTINDSVINETKNEITKSVENKSFSIFKDVKEIRYYYYIIDETKKYNMYKAKPKGIDVSIISTHKNSSIALAYQPKAFIVYDNIYLKIYNRDSQNLTLNVFINDKIRNYSINEQYTLFRFEFSEDVKKLRIQLLRDNETVFDTGTMTVIHLNFINWYEENSKETVEIEKGYLIVSNFWYFLSGGILILTLCVIIARKLKKKKEKQILMGWGL